jgi:hypothetical protein
MKEQNSINLKAIEALKENLVLIYGNDAKYGLVDCIDGYYSGVFNTESNKEKTNEAIRLLQESLIE